MIYRMIIGFTNLMEFSKNSRFSFLTLPNPSNEFTLKGEILVMNNVEKIIQLFENGQLDKAKKLIDKVKKSGSDEEQYLLAEELNQLGFPEDAKNLYQILLEKYPEEGELIVLLAETFVDLNQEEEAILLLEKIDASDPSYPRALLLLADLYQMQGLYEVSEQKLLMAKELAKDEPVIDFALGELYMEQGRYREAVDYYHKLIDQQIYELAGTQIRQRIAEALSAAGEFEEALPYYDDALDEKLEVNTLFGFGLTAYQAGYYQTAIEKFTELKALDPDYHSLYLYLARSYEHEEMLEQALQSIKEGIAHDEFQKELYFLGGKIALKLQKEDEAESFFQQALRLDPGYLEAALTLNKLYMTQERYSDILDIIKQVQNEGEDDPQFLWDQAKALHGLEQYSEALKMYQKAYNDFKNNQDFLEEYGYFLLEEGKTQKAAEIFHKLLEKDPTNEEWILLLERLE